MRLAQRESFPTRRTRREEQEIGEIDDEIRLRLTGGEREQQDEQQQQQQYEQQHAKATAACSKHTVHDVHVRVCAH